MNRKILVTLLQKNIEELNVITDGFMEMDEYPEAIIHLAKRKTEDIQIIIDQLTEKKTELMVNNMPYINVNPVPFIEDKVTEIENIEVQEVFVTGETVSPEPEIIIADSKNIENVFTTDPIVENANLDFSAELVSQPVNEETFVLVDEEIEEEVDEVDEEMEEIEEEVDEVEDEMLEVENEVEEIMEEMKVVETKTEEFIVEEKVIDIKSVTITPADLSEKKPASEEHKRIIIAEKIIQPTISRNELMSKGDNSLSASIANKKITDIKQAISIGDRFRFQRELFKGNGEEMNRTLNYINQLATFEEASSFLMSKYGWDKDNENVEGFLQIVKRRF